MASQRSTGKDTSGQNQPPLCETKRSLSHKTLEFPTYDPSGRYTPKFPSRSTSDLVYTSSPDTPNPNTESPSNEELHGVTPEELVFRVPNNEGNQVCRHTHAYLKSIGQIPEYIKFQELDLLKEELDHMVKTRLLLQLLTILL
jgi:hypothetical protein